MTRFTRVAAIALILLAITLAGASVLTAQDIARATVAEPLIKAGAIDGTVVDLSGRSLTGVEVVLLDSKQSVRTNNGGAYRVEDVEPGIHVMRFRRVGLEPMTLVVNVASNDITGADVVMGTMHHLSTVEVTAKSGEIMELPREFVEHMRTGTGHYMTQEDIERKHPLSMPELFSNIPGIIVRYGSGPGNAVVTSARGANSILADPCPEGMPVYLNGFQSVGSTTTAKMRQDQKETVSRTPLQSLDVVVPNEIAAIEVYAGPAGLPPTIPPSACGAIILWSK
jgi:carboxypeptidase family protein/TonB-dependent receptor-like protein